MNRQTRRQIVTDWKDAPVLMDVGYVCILLGVHEDTVRKLIHDGTLPATKFGQNWRIEKAALMKMVGAA